MNLLIKPLKCSQLVFCSNLKIPEKNERTSHGERHRVCIFISRDHVFFSSPEHSAEIGEKCQN